MKFKLFSIIVSSLMVGCAHQPQLQSPFIATTDTLGLMESMIVHAAEVYWDSVSVIVDEGGVTENYPETDEEWEGVWAAAVTIAESGNLLMMDSRAVRDDSWIGFSTAMVNAGAFAAEAALARDVDMVFDAGEQVYNACLACHNQYVTD